MGTRDKIRYLTRDPLGTIALACRRLRLRFLGVEFGPHLGLEGWVDVPTPKNVRIGSHVLLGRGVRLGAFPSGRLSLGDHAYVGRHTIILAYESVTIGSDTLIGPSSYITDVNHGIASGQLIRLQPYESRPVRIGSDVWFGVGVTVLPGVTIGDGAVVGARALVTKDIPAGAVAVGSPARVIRYRTSPDRVPEQS